MADNLGRTHEIKETGRIVCSTAFQRWEATESAMEGAMGDWQVVERQYVCRSCGKTFWHAGFISVPVCPGDTDGQAEEDARHQQRLAGDAESISRTGRVF